MWHSERIPWSHLNSSISNGDVLIVLHTDSDSDPPQHSADLNVSLIVSCQDVDLDDTTQGLFTGRYVVDPPAERRLFTGMRSFECRWIRESICLISHEPIRAIADFMNNVTVNKGLKEYDQDSCIYFLYAITGVVTGTRSDPFRWKTDTVFKREVPNRSDNFEPTQE